MGTALEKEWKKEIVYFKLFTDHGYFENIDKNYCKKHLIIVKYKHKELWRWI